MKKSIGSGRGSVYTIILKALQSGDKYGYEICKEIEEKSNGSYILKQPSLYSGLKRLETQKDVCSYWGDSDIGGRRHYYSLTEKGKQRIEALNFSWEDARDDLVGNLFEKSNEEKAVEELKTHINSVENDIDEIKQVNQKLSEAIDYNKEVEISENTNKNTEDTSNANEISNPKIIRHVVSPYQQDLFSFANFNNESFEEKSKETALETVSSIDNLSNKEGVCEEKPLETNKISESLVENTEQTANIQESSILIENEQKTESEILVEKQEEIFLNEKAEPNYNTVKAEESVINVSDYINQQTSTTLFDEKVEKDKNFVSKTDFLNSDSFAGQINIDENEQELATKEEDLDKAYENYLKMFEDEKEETKDILSTINSNNQQVNSPVYNNISNASVVENQIIDQLPEQETSLKEEFSVQEQPNYENNLQTYKTPETSINLKEIFGDFIKETKLQNKEELVENKEDFTEYNQMNFKAVDNLPRVDVSNNINLTLNYEKKENAFSTFKSYHDDDDFNTVSAPTYAFNNTKEVPKTETIPFDQKHAQSSPQTDDFVVRKYSKININNVESKYINLSKLHFITFFSTFIVMLMCTIIINSLVGKIFEVDVFQQKVLTVEYIVCGIILAYLICYQLLNKNKRKLVVEKNNHTILKIILIFMLEILLIIVNIIIGLSFKNLLTLYASFVLPTTYLIWFFILSLLTKKIKKTNYLFR